MVKSQRRKKKTKEFAENAHKELQDLDQDIFNKSDLIFYDKLRSKTSLELQQILGEDVSKGIDILDKWFTDQINPIDLKTFEANYEKEFEEICFLLSKHTNKPVKELSVVEFYTIILHLKKQKK